MHYCNTVSSHNVANYEKVNELSSFMLLLEVSRTHHIHIEEQVVIVVQTYHAVFLVLYVELAGLIFYLANFNDI